MGGASNPPRLRRMTVMGIATLHPSYALRVLPSSFYDVQLHIVGVRSTSPESILRQSVRANGFRVRAKRRAPE